MSKNKWQLTIKHPNEYQRINIITLTDKQLESTTITLCLWSGSLTNPPYYCTCSLSKCRKLKALHLQRNAKEAFFLNLVLTCSSTVYVVIFT